MGQPTRAAAIRRATVWLLPAIIAIVAAAAQRAEARLDPVAGKGPKEIGSAVAKNDEIVAHATAGLDLWKKGAGSRAEALVELRRAVDLADAPGSRPSLGKGTTSQRPRAVADALAAARFHLAEDAFEKCQAATLPRFKARKTLSAEAREWLAREEGDERLAEWDAELRAMSPRERVAEAAKVEFQHWVKTSFMPWLEQRRTAIDVATRLYQKAAEEHVPLWETAAAARVGETYLSFAQELQSTPVDPSIRRDKELVAIYRDMLESEASPYRATAIAAYERCLEVAKTAGVANEWTKACAVALRKNAPREEEQ